MRVLASNRMSTRLLARNKWGNAQQIFMKFDGRELKQNTSPQSNFG
jgi:hypothetical protein